MTTTPVPPPSVNGLRRRRREEGIFFHADDMGSTPTITTRLFDAWDQGLLDGFSVFGDCDHPEMIAARLQARPERPVRLAVHLNLWEGRPLVRGSGVDRLVDRSGNFDVEFVGLLRRGWGKGSQRERNELVSQIEREWRTQIENVIEMIAGRSLTALDGHLHMHMVPILFQLAVKLSREYGIPEIRNVREPFYLSRNIRECVTTRFVRNITKRTVLNTLAGGNARIAADAGLRSPDRLLGVLYSGMMSRANIVAGIAAARARAARRVEIVVHIGRAARTELGRWSGRPGKAAFVLSPARDAEYRELMWLRAPKAMVAQERRAK